MSDDTNDLDLKTLQAENISLQEEIEALKAECEVLQVKVDEGSPENLKEMAARAQADLQNAKDRMQREAIEIRKFALESTIMKLLPTIDNLQRAFAHLPDDLQGHDWVTGVAAVEKDMMKMLTESGLTEINTVGEAIDTMKHEVLQVKEGEKDTVIEVFENGYMLNEKVLRPAKVIAGGGE